MSAGWSLLQHKQCLPLGRPRTAFHSRKIKDRNHSQSSHNVSSGSRQQQNSMLPQERSLSQTANTLLWPDVDENQDLFSNTHPDNSFLDGLVSTSSWPPVEEYPPFELPLGEEEDTSLGTTPSLQDGLNTDISQTTLDALPFHSPSPGQLVNANGVDGFERPGDIPNLDAFARDNMIYQLPNTSHVAIWLARLNGTIARHLLASAATLCSRSCCRRPV